MEEEKRVLVVEDEESLRGALKHKLTNAGFGTLEAKNGEEGLALACSEHPDLILLDLVMPVMDGITMLHRLREDAWGKQVPVIILTNLNDADKTAEALNCGVWDVLIKSDWNLDDLMKKVHERIAK